MESILNVHKAFKKARDDELGRYLEGCLKNYKEGNMTSDDVTNAYYEKLISFKIGIDAIAQKFSELKKKHPEIKHPEKNNENRTARKHKREDDHHANPAVIDTTLLLEKVIEGLKYALFGSYIFLNIYILGGSKSDWPKNQISIKITNFILTSRSTPLGTGLPLLGDSDR